MRIIKFSYYAYFKFKILWKYQEDNSQRLQG